MPPSEQPLPDWNALAKETLDMWQEHLAAYAADPKAKADLAGMVAPASKMFAEWTNMMQHGLYGTKPDTSADNNDAKEAAYGDAASDVGVAELATRVAELERQLDELESQLAGKPAPAGETAKAV